MLPSAQRDTIVRTLVGKSSVGVVPTAQLGVLLQYSVRVGSCVQVPVPRLTVQHRISVLLVPLKHQSVLGQHGLIPKLQLAPLVLVTIITSIPLHVGMYSNHPSSLIFHSWFNL
jgi:hypothetical protein